MGRIIREFPDLRLQAPYQALVWKVEVSLTFSGFEDTPQLRTKSGYLYRSQI